MNDSRQPRAPAPATPPRRLLHVGCGHAGQAHLPDCFAGPSWHEVRYDIDPAVQPDLVGSITEMGMLGDASFDAIWSSHNLEHLDAFEVPAALREFRRVLKPDGFALITLPDLRAIARQIANDRLTDALYQSPAGPISPLDMLFGHQASLMQGQRFMAHRGGFTARTLGQALLAAGFDEARVHEGSRWDLWAVASMAHTDPGLFARLAGVLR